MNSKINIAIDGYSSCGKSTIARALAQKLNYIFIDSGAMYRAIALHFHENGINFSDIEAVKKALKEITLTFEKDENGQLCIHKNGENVEVQIRNMEISNIVSYVAAINEVRDFGVAQQQIMGQNGGVVMDGRDIGTVVFPDASLKIFVTADEDIRTERRWNELKEKSASVTKEEVKNNLLSRDKIDMNRKKGPLTRAKDALLLDTSHLTQEEQLEAAYQWALQKINAHKN